MQLSECSLQLTLFIIGSRKSDHGDLFGITVSINYGRHHEQR